MNNPLKPLPAEQLAKSHIQTADEPHVARMFQALETLEKEVRLFIEQQPEEEIDEALEAARVNAWNILQETKGGAQ